ncbi:MAG: hypothetical protein C4541_11745 [Candidatus Auribacter fodinae]|uniref:DNA/pantothenate metabolism flavoprotein C-terminal domain-containing protein n=1 Tax=Candidatus Auribacter fodinae TaxID=2093366 RepID=A0A3A4QWL8_9BACT|nr:MAG: hypothetical protein C4541_11745 [Candidatus Auribacter fodinae]
MKPLSFLITAGPTREYLDPVRFLSNPSTGKMGYALAEVVAKLGYEVLLISGPAAIPKPHNVQVIDIISAQQMCDAVLEYLSSYSVLIMAAAVCDYYAPTIAKEKIKKSDNSLTIEFSRTKDILSEVAKTGYSGLKVGFAAESHDLEENALDKLRRKKLNMIVANDITAQGAGFGSDTNIVTIYSDKNDVVKFPIMPKYDVAGHIVDFILKYIGRDRHYAEKTVTKDK